LVLRDLAIKSWKKSKAAYMKYHAMMLAHTETTKSLNITIEKISHDYKTE